MAEEEALGEVIESSTRQFIVEAYDPDRAPSFGSWVQVNGGDRPLYGLVSHVETGSYDSNREAVALGLSAEERAKEMPMVEELLRTTLRVQNVAYRDDRESIRQTLPPQPPGIHDFVYRCPSQIVRELTSSFDFLRPLIEHPDPAVPVDDLLVAVLRGIFEAHGGEHGGREMLVEAGRTLSRLLDDDHERLQSILGRVL